MTHPLGACSLFPPTATKHGDIINGDVEPVDGPILIEMLKAKNSLDSFKIHRLYIHNLINASPCLSFVLSSFTGLILYSEKSGVHLSTL